MGFPVLIPAGDYPLAVVVADFNRDGFQDFAVANSGSSDVTVHLGNGHGEFAPPRRYPSGDYPIWIASADLNGDGAVDLVVANNGRYGQDSDPGNIAVLLGRGDGTFGPQARYAIEGSPYFVAVADLNSDHRADLVVPALIPGAAVLLNQGPFPDGDGDGLRGAQDPCEDSDGDGFGDPGFPLNLC